MDDVKDKGRNKERTVETGACRFKALVTFGILGSAICSVSCGPAHPVLEKQSSSSTHGESSNSESNIPSTRADIEFAKNLDFQLVQKSFDQRQGQSWKQVISKLDVPIRVTAKQIILPGVVSLPLSSQESSSQQKELFLCWKDQVLGLKILDIKVLRQTLLLSDRRIEETPEIEAEHDSKTGVWYFSISRLFQKGANESGPQILILELALSNNENKTIEIHFRVME